MNRLRKLTLMIAVLLLASGNSYGQDGYTKVKEMGGIKEYQLNSNQLSVLLMEDHSAPVLTLMVTYNVGSRNEVTGTTGATHLLEHLMFKGTDKYNRADSTGLDAMLQNRGAVLNATTWLDRTNYYENLPSEHLELVVDIEADRMRNLWLREEDRKPEMTVVRNEFERGENSPFSALNKAIWASAIIAHPYHHSTIGWKSDIEGVPIKKLNDFYDTYYWPNNATVTLIGDFEQSNALALVKKYFGAIPKSPNPIPEVYTKEPEQQGARRVQVERAGQLGVVGLGFKAPEGSHDDYAALSVLDNILTNGKTSRLYRALVDSGKATNVFDFYFPFKDPSLFVSYAFLAPGATHEETENILWDEIEAIKKEGVSRQEVDRAINQVTAQTAFGRDGSFSIASQINEAIAMGDWTFYLRYPEAVKEVTPKQIQQVAQTYFVENKSTTGYFMPKRSGEAKKASAQSNESAAEQAKAKLYYRDHDFEASGPISDGQVQAANKDRNPETDLAAKIRKKKMGDMEIYTMQTGVKDVVTITGSMAAGDWYSPDKNSMIADMTGSMLDKGTTANDKFEIARQLENIGARISFSVGSNSLNFNAQSLTKDVPKVLELLAEQLQKPAFDAKELEKLKKQRKGTFQRSLEQPGYVASNKLGQILYPKNHPNYNAPVEQLLNDIDQVTVEDLKTFHRTFYGPKSLKIVAVGDLDSDMIETEVEKSFSDWNGGTTYKQAEAVSSSQKADEVVFMEDKTSVSVNMGIPLGIDEEHPDYLPLMLGTYVLGGNFSARLMSTVRDKEGLTYGIGSNISGATMSDGNWQLSATFAPNLLDKGMHSTMRELKDWVENGISAKELSAKKSTISGSAKVRLATTRGLASYIHDIALRNKPLSYADQYFKDIEAITLEEVNSAIQKYIDLDKLVVVKAGTVEKAETKN